MSKLLGFFKIFRNFRPPSNQLRRDLLPVHDLISESFFHFLHKNFDYLKKKTHHTVNDLFHLWVNFDVINFPQLCRTRTNIMDCLKRIFNCHFNFDFTANVRLSLLIQMKRALVLFESHNSMKMKKLSTVILTLFS